MLNKLICCFTIVVMLVFSGAARASNHETFYKGKTVRVIVGVSPGGGYDTYARTIARHMGKHIGGSPTIIVENMPGAGSLKSANFLYRVAKPDGLTIGHFIGGLFLQQLLGQPGVDFEAPRFGFIGVPAQDDAHLGLHRATGIASVEQWLAAKTPIKFGGIGPGVSSDDIPKVLKETLGLPLQLVSGYKGTADVRLAFNSGEVQGATLSWQSFKATWRQELETALVNIVLSAGLKPHPDLPKVPLALHLVKTEEGRKMLQTVIQVHGPSVRPFVVPPGTPKERVEILGRAFMATMKDPEFVADATKARLELNPLSGEELAKSVSEIFQLEAGLVAKLKGILR